MSTASLVRSLTEQSEQLSRDIDSFSDRAFELTRLAKALQERAGRQCADKATQVETVAVGAPTYQLDRAKRLAPFAFQPLDRKVNWRKLRALNVERVVRETDTRSVMELYGEVAYADLERESVYDLTEANLLKLVRVMQLLLQVQQHQLDQGREVQQLMREDQAGVLGLLGVLPHLDVKEVEEGLKSLQGDFYKVADADMDAMFAQVRTEERTGARDTLATNVDQVKQVLDLRVFGGGTQGAPAPSAALNAAAAAAATRPSSAVGGSRPYVRLSVTPTAAPVPAPSVQASLGGAGRNVNGNGGGNGGGAGGGGGGNGSGLGAGGNAPYGARYGGGGASVSGGDDEW